MQKKVLTEQALYYGDVAMPKDWDIDRDKLQNDILKSKVTDSPYPSWIKDTATARWKSPIGDAPALTAEQESQNTANTHVWDYVWNEDNQSWDLTDTKA